MGRYEENIVPIKIAQLAEFVSKVKRISLDEALFEGFEIRRVRQRRDLSKEVFEFYAYCLENYAIRKGISGMQAWVCFKETGTDDFVVNNFDLLHTQGMDYILDEIQRFINKRRK